MPNAYFKGVPTPGATPGTYSGELTDPSGHREILFENQPITVSGAPIQDINDCGEGACASYSADTGGKAKDIDLLVSVKITGTLTGGPSNALRVITKSMISDVKDTVVKIIRK